jgi:hypothetical protein
LGDGLGDATEDALNHVFFLENLLLIVYGEYGSRNHGSFYGKFELENTFVKKKEGKGREDTILTLMWRRRMGVNASNGDLWRIKGIGEGKHLEIVTHFARSIQFAVDVRG